MKNEAIIICQIQFMSDKKLMCEFIMDYEFSVVPNLSGDEMLALPMKLYSTFSSHGPSNLIKIWFFIFIALCLLYGLIYL